MGTKPLSTNTAPTPSSFDTNKARDRSNMEESKASSDCKMGSELSNFIKHTSQMLFNLP